jgi:hypothetical protein
MKKVLFFFLCSLWSLGALQAQERFTLSGYIRDARNGEDLPGATVYEPRSQRGAAANAYGFYSIDLPAGDTLLLQFSFVGYQNMLRKVYLTQNTNLNIELQSESAFLKEVEVKADKFQDKLDETQMSVSSLSSKEIKSVPVIFGEADLIKVLQLKPGVKSGGEGFAGLFVRGGGPDQNLILLDEALVYNPNHLFGLFSVFNPDAVKQVDLYKGDFPAQFGGRLSSVLDIKLNEGNKKQFSGSGGVGLIASRLTLEGPIQKGKSSYIISGRRTYFDIITRQINRANEGSPNFNPIPDYYFYDLNAKVNFELGEKDRLFISSYLGRDVFGFQNNNFSVDFNWGNITTTARWNHVFSPKLFLNTSFIFSDYNYQIENAVSNINFRVGSRVRDYNLKFDFDYALNSRHSLRFGAQATHHQFEVGRLNFTSDDGRIDFNAGQDLEGTEYGIYLNDEITLDEHWRLNAGLRISGFSNTGQWYFGIEPRVAARYKLNERVSLKASFAQMNQYLHLVSNSAASLPTDIWYPSNRVVPPQLSQQVAAGASILLGDGSFLLTNEVYYKWMSNQIDFRDGAQLFVNNNLDQEFVFGRGWSYGNEFYIEKKGGKTTGWIGYTLSWTYRQFADSTNGNAPINNGRPFFPRYDIRNDLSLVVMHQFNERWSLSGNFIYNTGQAVSLPTSRFVFQDVGSGRPQVVPQYLERNGFRMPANHRADINITRRFKPRWGESDLTLSVYNLYNRRNPFFLYIEELQDAEGNPERFAVKQVALFPIIPTLTFNFKF